MKGKNSFKNRLSMYVRGGVLALAVLSSQAVALTAIGNYEELRSKVKARTAESFVLTADIDCGGGNFPIIGTLDNPFIGRFNGDGFAIYNFKIEANRRGYVGLFGYVGKGAVIENLGVIYNTVNGSFAVGALAGGNDGTIRRCFSKSINGGDVIADGNSAGGLVGLNGGVIEESYSAASVRGKNNVGGLVGMQAVNVPGAGITDCYATGAVSGANNAGGLAGYVFGGSIRRCVAAGKVTGTSANKGGLVGYDYGYANSGWKTTGKTGTGETVQKAAIESCFWNTETTGLTASAGATGKNSSEGISTIDMLNVNTYDDNWKNSVWDIIDGAPPQLRNVAKSNPVGINISGAVVVLSYTETTYNGHEQKPAIEVWLDGTKLSNMDYYTRIPDNGGINAGTVKFEIHGTGNYGGAIDTSYTIKKAPGAQAAAPEADKVTHKSIKVKQVSVGGGQQVEYAISLDNSGTDLNWEAGKLEFTGLARNTVYYIFARLAENNNYFAGQPSPPLEAATVELTETDVVWPEKNYTITRGGSESVTLSVSVETSGSTIMTIYKWYYFNNNNIQINIDENWNDLLEGTYGFLFNDMANNEPSYVLTPTNDAVLGTGDYIYIFIQVTDVFTNGNGDSDFKTYYSDPIKITVVNPQMGKKPGLSDAAASAGAVVRGRTLVMSSPSASVARVRLIDMRGRTAAQFVSGRGASFSLSGFPAGRYIVEVREKGKRVSALPVLLK